MKNHKVCKMSDIITLSSDDEYEPAPKKLKVSKDTPPVQTLKEEVRLLEKFNFNNGHSAVESVTDLTATNCAITIIPINKSPSPTQHKDVDLNVCRPNTKSTENAKSADCLVISDDEPSQSDSEVCSNDVKINGDEPCKETSATDIFSLSSDIAEISENETAEDKVASNSDGGTPEVMSDVENAKESSAPECSNKTDPEHSELPPFLSSFLNECAESLKNTDYETRVIEKFPKMKKKFFSNEAIQGDINFKKIVEQSTARAKISAIEAIQAYRDVNSYILDVVKGSYIEIPEENVKKVKKLEKFINKITKKIKKLDEAEVDFDSDKNSVYMQHDRFSRRLKQAYDKYLQLIGKSPDNGKIPFVSSHYNEINRAISHSYKYNKFPNYSDIEKVVRKCVKKHNLNLNEAEIKNESKECFIKLGNMLQFKRKRELYDSHRQLLIVTDEGDPADKDKVLAETLAKSAKQGKDKLQEIIVKYASMQEKNEKNNVAEQPVSADSDDSHYESSSSGGGGDDDD